MSWSDLPADIAASVADRLADLARFRSVCQSWRSASTAHAARRRVPLLLLPTQDHDDTALNRRVWSPADDRLGTITLPAAWCGRSFLFASNHGWTLAVAVVSGGDMSAALVHPFTGASFVLPALPFASRGDYDDTIPREVVWDWSPHGVLESPGNGAFFCRPGDCSWRPVVSSFSAPVSSVTYCDGAFYLLDGKTCRTTVVDAETLSIAAVIEPPALEIPWPNVETNLAVSPEELLLLVRSCHRERRRNRFVKAFRADRAPHGGRLSPSWSQVAGIGERAVFVDHLRAFCVEANGLNGVRRNCVYLASSREEVINDYYGLDVCRMYTVSVLDLADIESEDNHRYGNLLDVNCSKFWQYHSTLVVAAKPALIYRVREMIRSTLSTHRVLLRAFLDCAPYPYQQVKNI